MPTSDPNPSDQLSDMVTFINTAGGKLAIPFYHLIAVELSSQAGLGKISITAGGYSITIIAPDAAQQFDDLIGRRKWVFSCIRSGNTINDPDDGTSISWKRTGV